MRSLPLIATVALILGSSLTGAMAQQVPKHGCVFNFAVTAEPPNYDCHQSQTYGFLHPLAAVFSYLVRYDPSQGSKIGDRPELLASIGRPLSWVDTRIVDEENRDLPFGEIGELVVRSEVVFPGYWRAPDKSAEMFFGDWLRTGDLSRRDADGYVYLADRAKFRIKTGGYNVFPTEVENVLAEHPAVHEVSVFGLPDKVWGDRIEAVVSLKPAASVTPDALKEFCREKIANFKIPKHIEIWTELPKGATGKILKRAVIDTMAERYAKAEKAGK